MSSTSPQEISSAQLRIESRWLTKDIVQIAVIGEIDLATTEDLQASLLDVIFTELPHFIEIDLAGVTFMDCSGLSALVAARHAATRTGCRLQTTKPQPIVRRLLEMTELLGLLTASGNSARPGWSPLPVHTTGTDKATVRASSIVSPRARSTEALGPVLPGHGLRREACGRTPALIPTVR